MTRVAFPFLSTRMKASGEKDASAPRVAPADVRGSISTKPLAAPAFKTVRREGADESSVFSDTSEFMASDPFCGCSAFDRFADAQIGAAATDIAGHSSVDVCI